MAWLKKASQCNMFPVDGQGSGNAAVGMLEPGAASLAWVSTKDWWSAILIWVYSTQMHTYLEGASQTLHAA